MFRIDNLSDSLLMTFKHFAWPPHLRDETVKIDVGIRRADCNHFSYLNVNEAGDVDVEVDGGIMTDVLPVVEYLLLYELDLGVAQNALDVPADYDSLVVGR